MIAAIENALLARLAAAAGDAGLGYGWRTLESYPEHWETYLERKPELRFPAAWATFAGADQVMEESTGEISARGTFYVLFGAEHRGNETKSRQGDGSAARPGSYQLLEDGLRLLVGQTLGLDISRLKPGDFRQVVIPEELRARGVSVLAAALTTRFSLEPAEQETTAPFLSFHADWDISPFDAPIAIDANPAAPGRQLPDDAHADAVDHVLLEHDA